MVAGPSDGLVRYFFCGVSVQGKIEREERRGRKEVLTKNVCMVFFPSFFCLFVSLLFGPLFCLACMELYRKMMKTNGGKIGYWKGREKR